MASSETQPNSSVTLAVDDPQEDNVGPSPSARQEVPVAGGSDQQEQHGGPVSTPQSFRGPLRYEVEASSPQLEAGTQFSLFVRITNPYDVPVKILSVGTQLPVEFLNPDSAQIGLLESIKRRIKDVFVAGSTERSTFTFSSTLPPGLPGLPGLPINAVTATRLGSLGGSEGEILQPGNTSEKMSTIVTRHKTFFIPAAYNVHIQIKYEMDGKINEDAIKQQFSIRAPLSAIIWGSLWGAIAGSLLRALYASASRPPLDPRFFADLCGGILLAAVVVIAFARKKDVQPFISVEDFWGGFFVGVIAAYGGKTLIDQYLTMPGLTAKS